jgi:serine/threonine protein kinase
VADSLAQALRIQLPRNTLADYNDSNFTVLIAVREVPLEGFSMIGKSISHYRIVEKIGASGMGEVSCAEDTNLNRQVAIKVLPGIFSGDPERLARLEREAEFLASLNHPYIAAIHGLEQADGKRFQVLELVDPFAEVGEKS